MKDKNIICTYQDLIDASNKDTPIEVVGESIVVRVENLRKGGFYVAPLYFWAQEERPIRVEIAKPGTKGEVGFSKDFIIDRSLNNEGKDQWVCKRYKLDKSRHNGTAVIHIGWPSTEKVPATTSFKLIAAPLTSTKLRKLLLSDAGLCPECGEPGSWQAMAMVCAKHGAFLGGS